MIVQTHLDSRGKFMRVKTAESEATTRSYLILLSNTTFSYFLLLFMGNKQECNVSIQLLLLLISLIETDSWQLLLVISILTNCFKCL